MDFISLQKTFLTLCETWSKLLPAISIVGRFYHLRYILLCFIHFQHCWKLRQLQFKRLLFTLEFLKKQCKDSCCIFMKNHRILSLANIPAVCYFFNFLVLHCYIEQSTCFFLLLQRTLRSFFYEGNPERNNMCYLKNPAKLLNTKNLRVRYSIEMRGLQWHRGHIFFLVLGIVAYVFLNV